MNALLYATIGLLVGMVVGVALMSLMHVSKESPDTERIEAISLFGWHICHNDGRWAILKMVNGALIMTGQSYPTLREAVDKALGEMNG